MCKAESEDLCMQCQGDLRIRENKLKAEIEQLTEALKEIAMMYCRKPDMVDPGARCAHCIADAALKK